MASIYPHSLNIVNSCLMTLCESLCFLGSYVVNKPESTRNALSNSSRRMMNSQNCNFLFPQSVENPVISLN